jgi:hypothetical protein
MSPGIMRERAAGWMRRQTAQGTSCPLMPTNAERPDVAVLYSAREMAPPEFWASLYWPGVYWGTGGRHSMLAPLPDDDPLELAAEPTYTRLADAGHTVRPQRTKMSPVASAEITTACTAGDVDHRWGWRRWWRGGVAKCEAWIASEKEELRDTYGEAMYIPEQVAHGSS